MWPKVINHHTLINLCDHRSFHSLSPPHLFHPQPHSRSHSIDEQKPHSDKPHSHRKPKLRSNGLIFPTKT
ncbi:hypothetical protein HanRHA438_Chr03g0120831 [Helianthus annuus]|uniref:Uncharacterized protein n=1 Tax=Helianthus annuus TaxID=4232 RepID=A0A251V727_HELAN|nr:hypothetical protein HanXRQr2_Chr03g0108681 [Helianthus annuus]KAJ0592886.1 hypothetical protein HanHA300_Chr03g0090881 [Helianthus annuus]KAJ0607887.1 hypothetical protein HanHA89_Chr03g0102501 [Helianthus annuus]KAJ0767952.1 hypothetical protein HanLR1_Chr03g0095881 [Helianthus annuus]KAJ0935545.1 hypothetical protein HanRHA438_Chr03g0120831 [Helianthus annuus]